MIEDESEERGRPLKCGTVAEKSDQGKPKIRSPSALNTHWMCLCDLQMIGLDGVWINKYP